MEFINSALALAGKTIFCIVPHWIFDDLTVAIDFPCLIFYEIEVLFCLIVVYLSTTPDLIGSDFVDVGLDVLEGFRCFHGLSPLNECVCLWVNNTTPMVLCQGF